MVIQKAKESAKRFRQELKKTIGASLIAAFGLVTGLAWKEVVEIYLDTVLSAQQSKLISALVITIISVAAIMLISKITSNPEEAEKK